MIDLEALEKKLDQALENETEESLRQWLREKRRESQSLVGFIERNRLKSVQNMQKPLDEDEAAVLLEQFPRHVIEDVLLSLENYKGVNRKYKSCYLTTLNWCKRRMKDNPQLVKSNSKYKEFD